VITLSDDWQFILIAGIFGFVIGFLLSWALLRGQSDDEQRERESVAPPMTQVAEERAALRSLRERQVEALRDFLALCNERVAAYAERDYRLDLYERSAPLQSAVPRDVFYAEVTHAINSRAYMQEAMRMFFRASATAPNPQIRDMVRQAWESALGGETPTPDAGSILGRVNGAIEDYVISG
jgi:hypothetical protein